MFIVTLQKLKKKNNMLFKKIAVSEEQETLNKMSTGEGKTCKAVQKMIVHLK